MGHHEDAQIAVDHEVAVGHLREFERNLCGLAMGSISEAGRTLASAETYSGSS
jgi:hypothetical protein